MTPSSITFNWDINFGVVIAAVTLLFAFWQARQATKKEAERMHRENQAAIDTIGSQLKLVIAWMQSQWGQGRGD